MHKTEYDRLHVLATARDRNHDHEPRTITVNDDDLLDLLMSVDIRAIEGWVSTVSTHTDY